MKIIIDTNVLVSATLADGKPEEIISFIIASDEWEWIGSDAILQEYREVLNRQKLRLSDTIKEKWVNIVESAIAKIEVAVNVNFPRDRKDEKFLACAVVGEADFLITGDRDFEEMQALLPNTIIISVAMFKEFVIDAIDG
ncbi:putative toxin-antitoxin system toxin component, PIN family [[Phormidium] sp. ETS-05]|uniref:putative toxin-antitoxin system toxin component, PIN family n=1 Tax=[Phormidium] sp. ETS-05 TaxID=222819 RepID=UPI0018EED01F|nr:putative toxin-antitoxin system toxin component, PIN family [[Phormidium] sp. ETS-05]